MRKNSNTIRYLKCGRTLFSVLDQIDSFLCRWQCLNPSIPFCRQVGQNALLINGCQIVYIPFANRGRLLNNSVSHINLNLGILKQCETDLQKNIASSNYAKLFLGKKP